MFVKHFIKIHGKFLPVEYTSNSISSYSIGVNSKLHSW